MSRVPPTRREVLQKAVYISPMILTLPAVLSFASAGSGKDRHDHLPRRNRKPKRRLRPGNDI